MRLLLLAVGLGLCSGTHAQIIAYIQDSETLLQQMPAYQEEWAVLKGYEAELEVVLVAKQKAIQDYYTSVMKQERRSCGMPPKWYTEVEDSLQRAQEALSAMVCEAA